MVEESQVIPLAPPGLHPRSDEEFATIKPNNLQQNHRKSNKCFVYLLATIVLVFFIFLVFATVFMRVETPKVRISSVSTENLLYGTSPTPSLNLTLLSEFTVDNKNFGRFKLIENVVAIVFYGNVTVGETQVNNGWRFGRRKKRRVNIRVGVRSSGLLDNNMNFSSEMNSGLVRLSSHVKLRGEVSLFNIIKRRRTGILNCNMSLNLTSHAVQSLMCNF